MRNNFARLLLLAETIFVSQIGAMPFSCRRFLHENRALIASGLPWNHTMFGYSTLRTRIGAVDWDLRTNSHAYRGRWRLILSMENEEQVAVIHSVAASVLREMHQQNVDHRWNSSDLLLESNLQMAFTWGHAKHGTPHPIMGYALPITKESLKFLRVFRERLMTMKNELYEAASLPVEETRAAYVPSEILLGDSGIDARARPDELKLSDVALAEEGESFFTSKHTFFFTLTQKEWQRQAELNGFTSVRDYKLWLLFPLDTLL